MKSLLKLNQKGIGHHLLLIVVAVVAVVGAAGYFVWQRQNNLNANAASGCVSVVYKFGGRSSCISHIQRLLNGTINTKLTIDGYYSTAVVDAVKLFQSMKGLYVDGVVGPAQTWPRLCSSARVAIEGGVVSTEFGNSFISAGCNSDSVVFFNNSTTYNAACRVINKDGSLQARIVQRNWPSKIASFANYIRTDSTYLTGYIGVSGPKGLGALTTNLSYPTYPTTGNVQIGYVRPPSGYAFMSPTNTPTSIFMKISSMPPCYGG